MKVIGLDNKEHTFNYIHDSAYGTNASSYHSLARELLQKKFPFERIYEEVTLPGTKVSATGKPLRADFFIPMLRIIVEVHGEQHYSFNPFYHKNKLEFYKGKMRDKLKKEFCDINRITYIELPYSESIDEWNRRIEGRQLV